MVTDERLAEMLADAISERDRPIIGDGSLYDFAPAELVDALTELQSLRARGARVKPLEWAAIEAARSDEDPHTEETGDYEAVSTVGTYTIELGWGSDDFTWSLYLDGIGVEGVHGTDDPEKLKAAAQADYERRILSALEASPAPVSDEIVERLRQRYTAEPVPPCPVCGASLTIQSAGGGNATVYGCEDHRPFDLSHYDRSRWTQFRPGDDDVLALLAALAAKGGQ